MKIGLLPLYIELYDIITPDRRIRLKEFYEEIAEQFARRGVNVEKAEFCRLKPEFEQAITGFEREQVDAIVTLHMAYSPSLESIEALVSTKLPIIVLDTTQTLEFTPEQNPLEIGYNHGIHGVMDMCSMLKRCGKPYAIAAGHYQESDCIDRVCGYVRAAIAATALSGAQVGLINGSFEGMEDFAVAPEELEKRFHIKVEKVTPDLLIKQREELSQGDIDAEMAENVARFDFDEGVIPEEYRQAIIDCLALRSCIQKKGYTAFSVNFQKIGIECGMEVMPFLECCKAMARGIGYAGEGDALTAAFTGALLAAYPETNFVEIFCPDWKNDMLFLSHMGEVNYRITDGRPLISRKGDAVDKRNPYAGYARMKGGEGVYVNISRGKEDYQLLLAPAQMISTATDNFPRSMRGWMKPAAGTTAEFLEGLSRNGATHHSSFVYGATVEELMFFGQLLSLETVVI